jgi:DNA-binding protein HU-beta
MVGISDLAKDVAEKSGVTQKAAKDVINNFLEQVINDVNKGKKVNLAGFGIFERKTQKARTARNPRTKATIKVPSKKKFVFRASSKVKYKK